MDLESTLDIIMISECVHRKVNIIVHWCKQTYRIVSNKRPGGVAIFQKGDVYKRQVFNAKMQCLSLFTMTHHREI